MSRGMMLPFRTPLLSPLQSGVHGKTSSFMRLFRAAPRFCFFHHQFSPHRPDSVAGPDVFGQARTHDMTLRQPQTPAAELAGRTASAFRPSRESARKRFNFAKAAGPAKSALDRSAGQDA